MYHLPALSLPFFFSTSYTQFFNTIFTFFIFFLFFQLKKNVFLFLRMWMKAAVRKSPTGTRRLCVPPLRFSPKRTREEREKESRKGRDPARNRKKKNVNTFYHIVCKSRQNFTRGCARERGRWPRRGWLRRESWQRALWNPFGCHFNRCTKGKADVTGHGWFFVYDQVEFPSVFDFPSDHSIFAQSFLLALLLWSSDIYSR